MEAQVLAQGAWGARAADHEGGPLVPNVAATDYT